MALSRSPSGPFSWTSQSVPSASGTRSRCATAPSTVRELPQRPVQSPAAVPEARIVVSTTPKGTRRGIYALLPMGVSGLCPASVRIGIGVFRAVELSGNPVDHHTHRPNAQLLQSLRGRVQRVEAADVTEHRENDPVHLLADLKGVGNRQDGR